MTMKQPILDELHAIREQMLADAGGTLAGLVEKIQADQAKSGRKVFKTTNNKALNRSGDQRGNSMDNQPSPPG